jgi:HEAT repeat protein
MLVFNRHKLSALGVCLALCAAVATIVGCAELGLPPPPVDIWSLGSTPDKVPGVKTPDERMAELKELANRAQQSDANAQERVSAELAKEIQQQQDPALRKQILRTLSAYPTATATAMMTAGLSDNDEDVRTACCEAWGRRGGAEAVVQLTKAMTSDTSVDVRLAAARALGETKDQAAVAPLAEALADADPAMQHRAIESLKRVSGRDFGGDIAAWREFAKTGHGENREPSLAERLKRLF